MSELLPCPFCGKRPHLIEPDYGDFNWIVSCLHCVAIDMQDISKEGVIEKWNRRHYPPEVQQAMERMKPVAIKPKLLDEYHPDGRVYLITCENCKKEYKLIGFEFSDAIQHCGKCGQALKWSE